jgi:hypothetical protein
MRAVGSAVAVAGVLGLSACAVAPPQGPSFAAMPGNGKTYAQFQNDDLRCRQTAFAANGNVSSAQAANQSGVGSAVVGTALGTAAGALIGSTVGAVGAGAAIGAGTGLLAGSAVGAGNAQASAANLQRNYDMVYAQCMVAAGESVPQPSAGPPGYPAGYPAGYGYAPYPYPYAYGPPVVYGPPVAVGFGWGWGWGGWHRRYW